MKSVTSCNKIVKKVAYNVKKGKHSGTQILICDTSGEGGGDRKNENSRDRLIGMYRNGSGGNLRFALLRFSEIGMTMKMSKMLCFLSEVVFKCCIICAHF